MPALGVALLFLLSGMFVLASVEESYAEYFDVHPEDIDEFVVKTGGTINYESVFYDDDLGGAEVNFTAYLLKPNGERHAGGVSPSTWRHTSSSAENEKTIKVTAPDTEGTYRLVVEYETDDEENPKSGSSQALVRVVVPITLKAEVVNNSDVEGSIAVMFWVDDKPIEDSKQDVKNLKPGKKETVTYEWVTDSLGEGVHTFKLRSESGIDIDEGEFYIGHNEYRWASIVMGIMAVILIISLIWVVRKPIKNYGKPKARR